MVRDHKSSDPKFYSPHRCVLDTELRQTQSSSSCRGTSYPTKDQSKTVSSTLDAETKAIKTHLKEKLLLTHSPEQLYHSFAYPPTHRWDRSVAMVPI
ncbi:hypothetical protein TNCV_2660181 [Trichonephila clavipes]|uniref:Uncharacterized protein n=1 Tax=Trichonephila clavipes TaxID=2585209 RepID=A0A8X6UYD2_TRICX|nr:hypothetical protein TNCV_2660181 [Trichonephila clavipes]